MQQSIGRCSQIPKGGTNARQVVGRRGRERQSAIPTDEQPQSKLLLQPFDLMADGGLRDVQFRRCRGEAEVSGGRFECATRGLLAGGFAISWLDRFPAQASVRPNFEAPISVAAGAAPVTGGEGGGTLALVAPNAYAAPAAIQSNLGLASRPNANRSNRHKYTCSGCFLALWGKPGIHVKCVDCDILLMEHAA